MLASTNACVCRTAWGAPHVEPLSESERPGPKLRVAVLDQSVQRSEIGGYVVADLAQRHRVEDDVEHAHSSAPAAEHMNRSVDARGEAEARGRGRAA
jgi:hypothetical protein